MQYVSNTKVEITAYNLTSSDEHDCDVGSYDDCIDKQRMLHMTNCSLPFELRQLLEDSICKTHKEGIEVVKEILALRNKCQTSCLQIDVKYNEKPEKYLLALAKPELVRTFAKYSGEEFGYFFQIPKNVKLSSIIHEYTGPVALGYFGSIVGIFIGISIFNIVEIIADVLNIKKQVRKWIIFGVKIVMIIYLLAIFIMLMMKFLQKPVANSINFTKTKSDFSISVCSLPYTYDISSFRSDDTSFKDYKFQLSENLFREKWRNISTMINTMSMDNGTHEIDLISEDYENARYLTILPYNSVSVAICHTIDLSQHSTIHKIKLNYNTEVEIYVHKQGQFLYEWIKKDTKILSSSKNNVKEKKNQYSNEGIALSNTAINLNMEIISSLQELSSVTFDNCWKDEGRRLVGIKLIQCYLDGSMNCLEQNNIESFEKMATLLNNISICNPPETVINIETSQSNYLTSSAIIKSDSLQNSEFMLEEDIGLFNKVTYIELIFSSFTKISKVRFAEQEKNLNTS